MGMEVRGLRAWNEPKENDEDDVVRPGQLEREKDRLLGTQVQFAVKDKFATPLSDIYGNTLIPEEGAALEGPNGVSRDFILGRQVAMEMVNGEPRYCAYREAHRLRNLPKYFLEDSGKRWRFVKEMGILKAA